MSRSLLDTLATRFCSLDGVSELTEDIYRLIWVAHDLAAADDLDKSEDAIKALVIAIEMAEREVGVGVTMAAAVVTPRFGGAVMLLKRGRGGTTSGE